MCRRLLFLGIFVASLVTAVPSHSAAATLPAGFAEIVIASGLTDPTAMQFAPDGRLFVCEQGGALRVIKGGELLPAPFVSLSVDASGERGLLGVAFDPNFSVNRFVYVYYTTASSPVHNRISRFTANGDVAAAGSEVVILDLDPLSSAIIHNGGAINFAADGTLFVAVGDNADGANAQSFSTRHGKMLRINADGSIPTDNPFYNTASGVNRAIWARGLRNPFTFALNPGGPAPTMIINDVGQETWEEINDGEPGANYGWPMAEGLTYDPALISPRYVYDHNDGRCAITGGAFYAPATATFPSAYVNAYFFADFCLGVIQRLDLATNDVHDFAADIPYPVDLKVGPDGALYYLARGVGMVLGVQYVSGLPPPSIVTHPASVTVSPGQAATFSVVAGGTGPFSYQWQRNGSDITGATADSYGIDSAQPSDNGSTFRVLVANGAGSVLSQPALLTVAINLAPTATIAQPATGALYSGGETIVFAGSGIDPEEGPLPAGAFTWHIDFHHDTHSHPFLAATSGITSGSFVVPVIGETSANVWYRVSLTVRDSAGRTHTVQRDLHPRVVRLTLDTSPPGLQLRLDGQPVAAPHVFDSVVGLRRTIGAPDQTAAAADLAFVAWSDGGTRDHTVPTPSSSGTYTARFRTVSAHAPPPAPVRFTMDANGQSVHIAWSRAPGATSYRLEAGTTPAAANLVNADVGDVDFLETTAPPGTYYARIRAVNSLGASVPSSEASVTVSSSASCILPPPAPADYTVGTAGLQVQLSWSASPFATGYRLEVGSAPAGSDLLISSLGPVTTFAAMAPPGTFFTRVRAVNACGASAPSAEVVVNLSCSQNAVVPTALSVTKAGGTAAFSWVPSLGAIGYRMFVGSAPGLSDVSVVDVGPTPAIAVSLAGVPPGRYFVRVAALGACGLGVASNEVSVDVP